MYWDERGDQWCDRANHGADTPAIVPPSWYRWPECWAFSDQNTLSTSGRPMTPSRPAAVYRANALPSAGPLPFMQTLMCDLAGGKTDDVRDMPHYPNARYVCVGEDEAPCDHDHCQCILPHRKLLMTKTMITITRMCRLWVHVDKLVGEPQWWMWSRP